MVPPRSLTLRTQYGTSRKSSDDHSGISMLRMANIQSGHMNFLDATKVHLPTSEVAKYKLTKGDLLVSCTNDRRAFQQR
jgi:type I restriction enzyme, S subunit